MSADQKVKAYDTLLRSARLLMGETTENIGKKDLRVVALMVMDEEMRAKKGGKKPEIIDVEKAPGTAEYSEDVMKPAFETEN